MRRWFPVIVLLSTGLLAAPAAADPPQGPDRDDRLAWWREARFGMFIHWGLYSILEGEHDGEDWHAEWIRTTARIPLDEYAALTERFNPVNFDADEWCRIAADAGMRYIVITTKHHDGFCLFDSAHTDFDVMSTPFARDVMAELADAARRYDLRVGWYHSIMDWRHPDYLPRREWEAADRPADGADFEGRFVPYVRAQVRELLTNYGDVGVMWFDGEWEDTWTAEMGNALYDECREIQPGVLVNNRVSKGREGMAGLTRDGNFAGDFGTPEQEVPATGLPGVDWESCITMNNHWGWNKADNNWKSTPEIIRTLCDIASKGGNLLLNVGPRPDGTFPPEAVERLAEIGAWMDEKGESIRGTTAGPFTDLGWGRSTQRVGDETTLLYFHVFDSQTPGRRLIPGLQSDVLVAATIGGGGRPINLQKEEDGYSFDVSDLPNGRPVERLVPVVAVVVNGEPVVYNRPTLDAPGAMFVGSTAIRVAPPPEGAVIRYRLDGSTPTADSPVAPGTIAVADNAAIVAAVFKGGRRVSVPSRLDLTRAEPERSPDAMLGLDFDGLPSGLRRETFHGEFSLLPDFGAMRPATVDAVPTPSIRGDREGVARRYTGWIRIDEPAVYRFSLTSDDGARLLINETVAVDNDGLHGPIEKAGVRVLAPGWHRIAIEWFNRTGGATLDLAMARLGDDPRPVTQDMLRHKP